MKKNTYYIYYSIIALFFSLANSYGQKNFVFNNLTVKEGLSSHIVYSIESDKDDMTWLISANGIDRFDGSNFKKYSLTRTDGSKNVTFSVNSGFFKDSKNKLWVYSEYGVYYYNSDLDRFEAFKQYQDMFDEDKKCIKISEVNNELLFFTWGSIVKWNRNNNKTDKLTIDFNTNAVCHYPSQGILIGTRKGLKIYQNNKVNNFQLYGNSLRNANISSLYLHPNGTIWIGTRHKGMFIIKNNSIQQLTSNGPYTIMDIMRYNGKVLVATDGQGIMVYSDEGKIIRRINNTTSRLYGFGLYDLHKDNKNRLWIASYGMGIFYYYPNKPNVFKYKSKLLNKIDANFGHEIYKDTDNRIILGTNKGMFVDADSKKPKILSASDFDIGHLDGSNFVINNILENSDGDYWVSSFGYGLFLLDRNSLKVKEHIVSLKINNKIYPINFIVDLALLDNNLFIKLAKGDMYSLDYKNNSARSFTDNKNVTFMKGYNDGEGIFYSTYTSSYLYRNNESIKIFDFSGSITDYICINDSLSVIATRSNGLFFYNYNKDSLYPSSYSSKLPQSIVQVIKEGENSIIVLAENKVFKANISTENNDFTEVTEIYNRFESINGASIIIDDKLILGGYDGFLNLPIYNYKSIAVKPKIIFDELEVEGKIIYPGPNSIIKKRINKTNSISLEYPLQDFKIKVTSPNYLDKNIYYSWKLVGYDDDFSETSTYKTISYNNLPSGNYNLKIRSYSDINGSKLFSRQLKIEVLPPLWQSLWAYIFYLLIIILFIIAASKYFITLRKQRNLKKRNQLFAEIAHEIRTPLTLIQGPLQQLEKEEGLSDSARRLLKGVESNLTKLSSRVSQLLDYERVQKISDKLSLSEFELVSFIKNLLVDFQPLLTQRNITVDKKINIDEFYVTLDEDKLEKIIYNLISNAIKYSSDNSKIEIILNSKENDWSFTVNDSGIGIPKKNQKNIFNRFYRADNAVKSGIIGSGIGLILSYKYAKLLDGDIVFESEHNKGTSFTLNLPKFLEGGEVNIPEDVSHYGEEFTSLSDKHYDYKIAIAEDNEELRDFLKEALSENFEVEVFENGKECYDGLVEDDYDLVLSDIMMPEMNGYELCDKIKGNIETSHLPIILLTALNASMYKAEGYEHGADHYVIKPFDIRMLKFRMVSLIENRQAIKKLYQQKISTGKSLDETEPSKPSLDSIFLEKLEKTVFNNLSDHEYGVQNICVDVGMSRPVLYRKLKALTNLSPKEYIQNKRLNLSKELLSESNNTISSIAYESGYSDPKYFSTAFKKKYGISPSEYVKTLNKNN